MFYKYCIFVIYFQRVLPEGSPEGPPYRGSQQRVIPAIVLWIFIIY